MSLVSLDIPDDPATWPMWLERHMVGLHLRNWSANCNCLWDQIQAPLGLEEALGRAARVSWKAA